MRRRARRSCAIIRSSRASHARSDATEKRFRTRAPRASPQSLGDKILPSSAAFESFAYELVRRRRTFEKLYRTSKRVAPRLVDAMALARSLIVGALEAIGQMDPSAAASLVSSGVTLGPSRISIS